LVAGCAVAFGGVVVIRIASVLLGWLVLSESPPALALAGGALCLAGVAVVRRGA
jgi:drug/metabolite transporter superfamily protein YnfA